MQLYTRLDFDYLYALLIPFHRSLLCKRAIGAQFAIRW